MTTIYYLLTVVGTWLLALLAAYLWWRRTTNRICSKGPEIIVIGSGPPKRSAVDILMNPSPMPKWKPVEDK